ncbi:MAG: S41 family peptidase [bacterium]
MKKLISTGLFLFALLMLPVTGWSIDTDDTRLLSEPAISDDHIAFIYDNDLWVANQDGSYPRRLTVDEGVESRPYFSPDGKHIAFSAEYDGNTDLFIVPVEGGIPKRLTWHPGSDVCSGFTPDGEQVLFLSQREVFTTRFMQLFTISLDGGHPEKLVIPHAYHADFSPDGKMMAYTPYYDAFRQWKNYRGGTISTLYLFSFDDHSVTEIPKPEGGCNDVHPMWIGEKVYFLSDRNGEFNLFSYDTNSKNIEQLSYYEDFPIVSAKHHNGKIIFEQSGYLHTYETQTGNTGKLTVGIATDLQELRPRYVKGDRYVRGAHISPSGARAIFGYRGDILTAPAEKGDPRNITESTGANDRYPAWSPDGKSIAWFSDASGEYKLHIKSRTGEEETRKLNVDGSGFYSNIHWSPDSKMITYVDNARNFYVMNIESGEIHKIDSDDLYVPGPFRDLFGSWSPDSRWLAYTRVINTNFRQAFIYSVEEKKSYELTDGLSDATEPVFDRGGKFLYFLASTDAGPVLNWFDLSSADMEMSHNIYLVTLQKETINPFASESDEEIIKEEEKEEENDNKDSKKNKKKDKEGEEEEKGIKIDFENIQNRIVALPVETGRYSMLQSAKEGEILFIANNDGNRSLKKFTIEEREDKEVDQLDGFIVSADGNKMLYRKNGMWGIGDAGVKPESGKGVINTGSFEVKIHPKDEWKQIFEEAWRINRDYFYDPGMHGADWPAMKEKYEVFLPHLATRNDLNRIIQWMCSELAVGHHRVGGGASLNDPDRVPGGLLGADYIVENNRYRIEKLYEGLNWNPRLRSPLTEPGLNVEVGEYILAVNGKEVTAEDNFFKFFENTADKIVEIEVGPNPDGSGSRKIEVVPVRHEYDLRNRDWVEGNLKKVHEATNGQVAYVYVPNTAGQGHEYFKRYFFPQADKKAIIVDERFNGGGLIADYYIDLLMRPYQSHWNMRYANDLKTPSASIQGPKVMLINELAGSGGDMLPWMFRKFDVGTLVGKRTWGGLVGTLGFPVLMDGGYVTAPNVAIWTEDGFIVENVGVPPDVEVEQTPSEVIRGHDPQLEKAIEIILEELEKNPPKEYGRPEYPVRVRE